VGLPILPDLDALVTRELRDRHQQSRQPGWVEVAA